MVKKSIFNQKPKSKKLADIIDITSPTAFKRSISTLKKGGITRQEKRALVLGKNRAVAQLNRKNLSTKERKQFNAIKKINLPDVTKKNNPKKPKKQENPFSGIYG